MTDEQNPWIEVGNLMASLLASPQCPETVRKAIVEHLNSVYERANLTRPDLVRLLYHHLAADLAAPAQSAVVNGESDETVLDEVGAVEAAAGLNGRAQTAGDGEVLETAAS
ncbi:MAG TPA: hypothetical protein VNQ79_20190 [Blastocatellia bacterium]|nr:hypothetical protein [Blastocatellia bacterium]